MTNHTIRGPQDAIEPQTVEHTEEELAMIDECAHRISRLKIKMLLNKSPFYALLTAQLETKVDTNMEYVADTNGTEVRYNPKYCNAMDDLQFLFVMAHETMHNACKHPFRLLGRDHNLWNEACDYFVNDKLIQDGFTPPPGILHDKQYSDMSADQIYDILWKQAKQSGQQGNKSGNGKQGPKGAASTGTFSAPPEPKPNTGNDKNGDGGKDKQNKPQANKGDGQGNEGDQSEGEGDQPGDGKQDAPPSKVMTELDWDMATEAALQQAKKAGKVPAGMEQHIKEARIIPTNSFERLLDFVVRTVPTNQSFSKPNRKFLPDFYLPGVLKENLPRIAIGWDSSGSVWYDLEFVDLIAKKCTEILREYRPEAMEVLYCDTRIAGMQTFEPDDEVDFKVQGGGGTRFEPVFEEINQWDEKPACLIYFTDLEGSFPDKAPEYPVLWAIMSGNTLMPPFGEVVKLNKIDFQN